MSAMAKDYWDNQRIVGMRVYVNPLCSEPGPPRLEVTEVRRTWHERLCVTSYRDWCTSPFEPWHDMKIVERWVPTFIPKAYRVGDAWHVHPAIEQQLRELIRQDPTRYTTRLLGGRNGTLDGRGPQGATRTASAQDA